MVFGLCLVGVVLFVLLGCFLCCVPLFFVSAWWNRGIADEVTIASFCKAVTGTAVMARSANEEKKKWISASAHSEIAKNFIHQGAAMEADLDVRPFFSRVPTHSNFGDAPSRGKFALLQSLGAERTMVSDDMICALCEPSECG